MKIRPLTLVLGIAMIIFGSLPSGAETPQGGDKRIVGFTITETEEQIELQRWWEEVVNTELVGIV